MPSILHTLNAATEAAFEALGYPAAIAGTRESDRPDMAPFQCNGAMAAAGIAKKRGEKVNPRDIAGQAVDILKDHPAIDRLDIAGPGFINLHPTLDALSTRASELKASPSGGIPQETPKTIVIDYGGANVAKPMHVGHLRSAVIGEAIKRILRAQGHTVIGDVHMGDWGLQMGHLISELSIEQPDLPYFDADKTDNYPSDSPVTMDDLARLYPKASNAAKSDPDRMEKSRVATAELQAGRAGYRALLEHFINVSVAALKVGYGNLGVEFDLWKGEACVDPLIPDMIDGLKAQGITEEDGGALIIRVEEEGEKKDVPPVMLLASSGAVLYHTTDLATLVDRKSDPDPGLIVYVVDQRQALHFEQVFRAAVKAGWYDRDQLFHAGFGTMNGKDGKPFKTREGGVLRLEDLLEIMNEAAAKRLSESGIGADFEPSERTEIARKVGLAALKFADLQNQRMTNYVFDPERFTAFEGKTGPYLLYAVVRIKSILRRADEEGASQGDITVIEPAEQQLVMALDAFGRAVTQSAEKYAPHILCDHIYRVAQSFSRFYSDCPIMVDDVSDDVRGSRLSLAALTLAQLEMGLTLLGIDAPERM
ncbi:arginine--tRNA ligase [Fretibacter rubidus]|uniref:arginine--tRNA ligase n=1 Tax=Fretibacter rubidus TaxID=570162 RepID=UPI00352B23CC